MSSLRVLNVDHVLPRRPFPPPGDTVALSFFDTFWVSYPPVQRLLLFPNTTSIPFPTLVQSLKSSLSDALNLFHPLAGKLTYLPATADITIDCSPAAVGDGVTFITADTDIDFSRLAGEATHDLESFIRLVPELDVRELPAQVFVVQVTRFPSGGVAVGYAMHHTVVDGRGVWRFLETWAEACRGEAAEAPVEPPVHDRAVILHPTGNEIAKRFTRAMAPDLPRINGTSTALQVTRRTFTITPNTIKSLNFINAKAISDSETTGLTYPADCRTRLNPPISEAFTGNCVRALYLNSTGAELRAGGLEWACTAIKKSLEEFLKEPLGRCEEWVDELFGRSWTNEMSVAGSPWFRAYDIDFGFGKPGRVELVSMNRDGQVALLGGRGEGEVQASVALSAAHMDVFASAFATQVTPV